jgi:hypothetical protein
MSGESKNEQISAWKTSIRNAGEERTVGERGRENVVEERKG